MRSKIVVSKFGGTSVGDAACMLRSSEIALKNDAAVVVVSATSGTTNALIELANTAAAGDKEKAEKVFDKISSNHFKIAFALSVPAETTENLTRYLRLLKAATDSVALRKKLSAQELDEIVSFGEMLSSLLFVEAMRSAQQKTSNTNPVKWLDAREIIITDSTFGAAAPATGKIFLQCQKHLLTCKTENTIFVTQGFIGRDERGSTTTLGRGGSDYSAALIAEGIAANTLEIWTDVQGIATTDPRICPDAKYIDKISYTEASELATFGAKVLHPATIHPAVRQLIPIFVGSSFDSEQKGTWICHKTEEQPLVRAMAIRRKQALLTITNPQMVQAHGFLSKLFKVFDDFQVSIDAITTSEMSVSVTLEESVLANTLLIMELEFLGKVAISDPLALVAVIGNKINETPGLVSKVFGLIPDINIRMICQGASPHNLCFLVDDSLGESVLKKLHTELCSK